MIEIGPDKPALRAHLKALRKAHEAAGATVALDFGAGPVEITVDTQGDDVAKLTALFVRVQAGMQTPPLAFKGGGRFYSLSVAQLGQVAEAAAAHINAGYAAEAVVAEMVDDELCRTPGEVADAFAAAVADEA
jgi:hypothetical protein